MRLRRLPLPRSPLVRLAFALAAFALVAGLLWWRGPSFSSIGDAFTAVKWQWVVLAIALNLLSVVVRALAWRTVIHQAMPEPRPGAMLVFSAFSVGLFANAVLPGRIGELARVAVLTRKFPRRPGLWATLVGTVFAHRVFDVVPVVLLVIYVLITAGIPGWALGSLAAALGLGAVLFAVGVTIARRHHHGVALESVGRVRRVLTMARQGLAVLRTPLGAGIAVFFQICGWLCQLLAVYTAMRAFHIHSPLPAAGVVLLLMNVVTIFPFSPGDVGLVQVAIASALTGYGVAYGNSMASRFGLQAIEASVGIGVGLLFLAREGLSFAMLRVMPTADQADLGDAEGEGNRLPRPERAPAPG